jgi:hypothetical protein
LGDVEERERCLILGAHYEGNVLSVAWREYYGLDVLGAISTRAINQTA